MINFIRNAIKAMFFIGYPEQNKGPQGPQGVQGKWPQ